MRTTHLLAKLFFISIISILVWGTTMLRTSLPSAEEVYQEYFSEYAFDAAAKRDILTDLKLLINYFAYTQALGNNDKTLIEKTKKHARKQLSSTSIQMELEAIRLLAAASDAVPLKATGTPSLQCEGFSDFLQYQQDLVIKYQLPYHIENSALQLININEGLVHKEHNAVQTAGTSAHTHFSSLEAKRTQLRSFSWRTADIIVAHRKDAKKMNAVQGFYNHIGLYSETCDCIIDAVPASHQSSGGIRQSSWADWADNYTHISILRVKTLSNVMREKIASYALERVDEPYNISTYKKNEAGGWNCSKLVYSAYLHAGIDLDRKHGTGIFPDDIAMHPGLETLTCLTLEP